MLRQIARSQGVPNLSALRFSLNAVNVRAGGGVNDDVRSGIFQERRDVGSICKVGSVINTWC
jgi:hypothetical protein